MVIRLCQILQSSSSLTPFINSVKWRHWPYLRFLHYHFGFECKSIATVLFSVSLSLDMSQGI